MRNEKQVLNQNSCHSNQEPAHPWLAPPPQPIASRFLVIVSPLNLWNLPLSLHFLVKAEFDGPTLHDGSSLPPANPPLVLPHIAPGKGFLEPKFAHVTATESPSDLVMESKLPTWLAGLSLSPCPHYP